MTLQRAEPGDRVEDGAGGVPGIGERRERARERALVVVGDHIVDEPADGGGIGGRIETAAAYQLADLVLDDGDGVQGCASRFKQAPGGEAVPPVRGHTLVTVHQVGKTCSLPLVDSGVTQRRMPLRAGSGSRPVKWCLKITTSSAAARLFARHVGTCGCCPACGETLTVEELLEAATSWPARNFGTATSIVPTRVSKSRCR